MNQKLTAYGRSPTRSKDMDDSDIHKIQPKTKQIYDVVKQAVGELMAFITENYGKQSLCVTYFDEAHELEILFWILLRLLNHQDMEKKMWYVFMGTKLNISYFIPAVGDCASSIFARTLSSKNNSAFYAAP